MRPGTPWRDSARAADRSARSLAAREGRQSEHPLRRRRVRPPRPRRSRPASARPRPGAGHRLRHRQRRERGQRRRHHLEDRRRAARRRRRRDHDRQPHLAPARGAAPSCRANAASCGRRNYPAGSPGRSLTVQEPRSGEPVAVVNLSGAPVHGQRHLALPRRRLAGRTGRGAGRAIIVDFHAEATSEKVAIGHYLDGRVTAVLGTHTHVQTADARVLPGGTAYVTDVGMTGPHGVGHRSQHGGDPAPLPDRDAAAVRGRRRRPSAWTTRSSARSEARALSVETRSETFEPADRGNEAVTVRAGLDECTPLAVEPAGYSGIQLEGDMPKILVGGEYPADG